MSNPGYPALGNPISRISVFSLVVTIIAAIEGNLLLPEVGRDVSVIGSRGVFKDEDPLG